MPGRWMVDAETGMDILLAKLAELDAKAEETKERVKNVEADVGQVLDGLYGKVQEFSDYLGDVVESDLPQLLDPIVYRVDDATDKAATRLDDFLFQLEDVAASGNLWAEQLVGVIHAVEEGVVSAEDAMKAFGNGVVQFDGELRPVRDLLQDLLPTMGQVQKGIDDTIEKLKKDGASLEDLIGRLHQQHNTYAQDFARLLEAFQEGRVTLEAVIQAAQRLQETLPGTESEALGELIQQGLRNGDFG